MKTASQAFDGKEKRGDPGRRRRARLLLLAAAAVLLASFSPFARTPQKEARPTPKQSPTPQPPQRPPLKVSARAEPSSLELCPGTKARVRLSVSGLDGVAGFGSYVWKESAGDIEGGGQTVNWDLSGVKPGVHTAEVFVSFRAPSGAPLANGRATARVTLRECRAERPGPTRNTGQEVPGVVTPKKLETTPSPPRRTPTPAPTTSPTSTPTPSPTATLTPPQPDATVPPGPASGPNEAAPTEPSGVRGASYLRPFLIILLLLLLALAVLWLARRWASTARRMREAEEVVLQLDIDESRSAAVNVSGGTEEEEVLCSVFAPHSVAPGDGFLVQAFAHLAEQVPLLKEMAKEAEQRADRRGEKGLGQVARGQVLSFQLEAPGLLVDEPSQSVVWRGRVESAQFGVTVPESSAPRTVNCKLTVVHPNMLGHIRFTVGVTAAPPPEDIGDRLKLSDELVRYRQAFVSYASEDRAEVLKRVQMLRAMKVRFFQDVLSLEPGERWRRELYRNIDLCDVFLLFWSGAARRSEWVEKEARYALARKAGGDANPPEIVPVILQGPPEVPPPDYLPEYHFNDPLAYFIKAEEAMRRPADKA